MFNDIVVFKTSAILYSIVFGLVLAFVQQYCRTAGLVLAYVQQYIM